MLRWLARAANVIIVITAVVVGYQLYTDPVPYSTACFQPDREARVVCYQRLSENMLVRQLASMLYADPHQLMQDKPYIVEYYRQAWLSGMFPRSRMTPHEFSRLIDEIVNAQLGLPI